MTPMGTTRDGHFRPMTARELRRNALLVDTESPLHQYMTFDTINECPPHLAWVLFGRAANNGAVFW